MDTKHAQHRARNLSAVFALLIGMPLLHGCAFYGSGVSGYVYEWIDPSKQPTPDNLRPVPDAYVVAIWDGTVPRPIDATSTCLNVKLGKTDAAGHYDISGWFRFPRFYPVFMHKAVTREYKPGYVMKEWGPISNQFNFVLSTQTPNQRLEYLSMHASVYCKEIGDDLHRELRPYYQAILDEMRSLQGVSPVNKLTSEIVEMRRLILKGETGQRVE